MHNCKDLLCDTPHYSEPIDTGFTDKTISISCEECDRKETGLDAMVVHIKTHHPDYTDLEANEYAMRWMDAAYDREEENERNYQDDQLENRGFDE